MKQIIILMTIFGFLSCNPINRKDTTRKVILVDNFDDNSNGWVNLGEDNPTLIQKIDNGKLYLESSSEEMGVISYINLDLNYSKDFSIESKLMIERKENLAYASLDFGILKKDIAIRNINGINVPTTLGDKNFYFGISDTKEILIAKWDKGKEIYYFRGHNDLIRINDYNKLFISKKLDSIYYYLNDNLIFKQRFEKLAGKGFGFSTAPNSKLLVDYIKIIN